MVHPAPWALARVMDRRRPEPAPRSWGRTDGRVGAGYHMPRSADASLDAGWLAWAERALAVIVNGQFVDLCGAPDVRPTSRGWPESPSAERLLTASPRGAADNVEQAVPLGGRAPRLRARGWAGGRTRRCAPRGGWPAGSGVSQRRRSATTSQGRGRRR